MNPTQIARLRASSLAIVQFMARVAPSDLFIQIERVIEDAFERRDLRGLRMLSKDVPEWTQALSDNDRRDLDAAVRAEFGPGINDRTDISEPVRLILRQGKISSKDEYRMLMVSAEEIYANPASRRELDRINRLLAEYEKE
jgi:hypothetical protein